MIFALCERELDNIVCDLYAGAGFDFRFFILEQYAFEQRTDLIVRNRMLECDSVDLVNMFFRVCQAMNEFAVVGKKEQSGCVFVKSSHRLQFSGSKRRREQADHGRMVQRLE